MSELTTCPNCGADDILNFYNIKNVPVNSVLLLNSLQEARDFPTGNISLALCKRCSFVFNSLFNNDLIELSSRYESTQAFSPTFNLFHHNLAEGLIKRYNIYNKKIIEIGCGQGEFLNLLCEIGGNSGLGFDPVFHDGNQDKLNGSVKVIKDFFSEKYKYFSADFYCCKMTLEHIQKTNSFIGMLRRSIGDNENALVFFQVPNSDRIFNELAFWDVYYEHCSYFNPQSLSRLFSLNNFDVIDLEKGFDDQYLMIVARPKIDIKSLNSTKDPEIAIKDFLFFKNNNNLKIDYWKNLIKTKYQNGNMKLAVWGASSKTVAFLTTLGIGDEISVAIDINPQKEGTYIAGTGQQIRTPEFLQTLNPDVIFIMNPIYKDEISKIVEQLNLKVEFISVF